jgi:hypothetical protein
VNLVLHRDNNTAISIHQSAYVLSPHDNNHAPSSRFLASRAIPERGCALSSRKDGRILRLSVILCVLFLSIVRIVWTLGIGFLGIGLLGIGFLVIGSLVIVFLPEVSA